MSIEDEKASPGPGPRVAELDGQATGLARALDRAAICPASCARAQPRLPVPDAVEARAPRFGSTFRRRGTQQGACKSDERRGGHNYSHRGNTAGVVCCPHRTAAAMTRTRQRLRPSTPRRAWSGGTG
jgi:hypothetical protein